MYISPICNAVASLFFVNRIKIRDSPFSLFTIPYQPLFCRPSRVLDKTRSWPTPQSVSSWVTHHFIGVIDVILSTHINTSSLLISPF